MLNPKNGHPGTKTGKKPATFENPLRGWLDFVRLKLTPDKGAMLNHTPVHLNIFTNIGCPLSCKMCYGHSPDVRNNFFNKASFKDMDLETFKFILDKTPEVETIEFSGWGEPLVNPDLFAMVEYAREYNGAISTVVTNGLLIENRMDAMLDSGLHTLVVSINGHTPESYAAMTGMPEDNFTSVRKQVAGLMHYRLRKRGEMQVWLSMIVDTENYRHIPDMIALAEDLCVDGVRLENFLSPDPSQKSERTLYSDNEEVRACFDQIAERDYNVTVVLPQLLDREMGNHRNCQDAYTAVGVDGDCNITACSRQMLYYGKMGKIWEPDYWHNDMYQWLRGVYGPQKLEVPRPCQGCPKNSAQPARVLTSKG